MLPASPKMLERTLPAFNRAGAAETGRALRPLAWESASLAISLFPPARYCADLTSTCFVSLFGTRIIGPVRVGDIDG